MKERQPDARAGLGQRLEDETDAILEGTRKTATDWMAKLMRGHPGNARYQAAILGGVITACMDQIWALAPGDPVKLRASLSDYADGYLGLWDEDQAADAEDSPSKGPADAP